MKETKLSDETLIKATLECWYNQSPRDYKKNPAFFEEKAKLAVKLTREEMDTIKVVSPRTTDLQAWEEAKRLFCITKMPSLED